MGELADLYRLAAVVFVGGSLVPAGGHNMLEPALRKKPVLYGPHATNFRDSAALLESVGAAVVVADAGDLERQMTRLLRHPDTRREMGEAGFAAVAARQGAVAQTLALVERVLVDGHAPRGARGTPMKPRTDPSILLRRYWENPDTPVVTAGLAALSVGYRAALTLRETAYRVRLLGTGRLACPVISIGNITLGGSGKTPVTELAVRTLRELGGRPAVVSRGYGRHTRGVHVVADRQGIRLAAHDAGDEPRLLAERLPGVPVVVGENRLAAGRVAAEHCGATVIVLDDGFQHRTIAKDLEIVVVNGQAPWGNARLFPRGMLREPLAALGRADLVVVTNPPGAAEVEAVSREVGRHNRRAPVLTAVYEVVDAYDLDSGRRLGAEALAGRRLLAFAGLGTPRGFADTLAAAGVRAPGLVEFPDHHWYAGDEVADLARQSIAVGAEGLITTEKDAVRLRGLPAPRVPLWVLSVRLRLTGGTGRLGAGAHADARPRPRARRDAPVIAAGEAVIVVRGPNWLGDTVMALPALRALRAGRPAARITLAGRWAELLAGQGVADVLLPYPRPARERGRFNRALGATGADLAILFPSSLESALAARRWRARRRLGFDADTRGLLLTDAIPLPIPRQHQVDEYARLLEPLGVHVPDATPTLDARRRPGGRSGRRRACSARSGSAAGLASWACTSAPPSGPRSSGPPSRSRASPRSSRARTWRPCSWDRRPTARPPMR